MLELDIYRNLKEEIKARRKKLGALAMASLVIGQDESGDVYLTSQKKLALELDIDYRLINLKKNISQEEAIKVVEGLNSNVDITGIFVNRPLPKNWQEEYIFTALDINKDIEGLNPYNLGRLCLGKPLLIPPTVLSVLEYLRGLKIKLYGKEVVIIGFSVILGKPLALLLADKLATVNITHIATFKTDKLPEYVNRADIVISAVGKPNLIKAEWIKKNAVVIDVGISRSKGKITGDVEYEKAKRKASFITPVPGGVGKLTTLFLFRNLIQAAELMQED